MQDLNWPSIIIGAVIGWLLTYLLPTIEYIRNLFVKDVIVGDWYEYHVTKNDKDEFLISSGILKI